MTAIAPAALRALEQTAFQAASAERDFRESCAREIEFLERERQRAYRRYNFLAALVAADAGAADRAASHAAQRTAAMEELGWSANEPGVPDILAAMTRLADAIHDERLLAIEEAESETAEPADAPAETARAADGRAPAILFALSEFEERYERFKGSSFASQFDRSFAETPLVDF